MMKVAERDWPFTLGVLVWGMGRGDVKVNLKGIFKKGGMQVLNKHRGRDSNV